MIGNPVYDNRSSHWKMPAVDAFFYLMLAVCIVFQTWGYSFGDRSYVAAVAFMGILVVAKIATSRYSGREIVICLVLVCLGIFFAARAHRYTLLLTAVLLIAAKGIDVDELLQRYLWVKAVALVLLFVLVGIGVFDVTTVQHYRMTTGEFETRTLINGAGTNILHLGLFTVVVLWLYRKYGRITLLHLAACLGVDFFLYLTITRSTAGLVMTALGALLMYLCSRFRSIEKAVMMFSPAAPFFFLAIAVATGYLYGSSSFADALNKVSTGRIAYDHYWLTTYGASLFGMDFSRLMTEGNFDDSFVYVLVIYGTVFAALLYGTVTVLLVRMRRGGSLVASFSCSFSSSTASRKACIPALWSTRRCSCSTGSSSAVCPSRLVL